MTNILDPIPTWAIMLVTFAVLFVAGEAGIRIGSRKGPAPDGRDPSALLETTAFTLLALLAGFSFSMALGRYDARRGTFLREANAIGTLFLRTQLLEVKTASAARADLRAYVAARLAFARADAAPLQRSVADERTNAIQADLWRLAIQSAHQDAHSTMTPLFVAALNDVIDLSTEERAVLTNHIPDVVVVWLLLIALIAAGMMGYGFGKDGKRAVVFRGLFALMVALVFGLILDLDRPQRGIIRVNLSAMERVQQAIETPAAPSVAR